VSQNHELRPPAPKRDNVSSSFITLAQYRSFFFEEALQRLLCLGAELALRHRFLAVTLMLPLLIAVLLAPVSYWLIQAAQGGREIRAVNASASPGQSLIVAIELNSQGDENASGFSLNFNPALLSYQSASLGNGVPAGAAFFINPNAAASGRIGFTLALPAEQKFQAGARQVFTVTFNVANNAVGSATLSFGDDPARRDVADVNGNSLPCNYTTGTVTFVQHNPAPIIANLDPANRDAGSGAFTLTVNGSNFVNGAVVRWQGSDRATTFVNSSRLQAAINANDVAVAGTASVTVFNPAPGGGLANIVSFTINQVQTNPLPVLTSLEPTSRIVGSGAFTLTVNGSGFLNVSSVRWNGAERLTTFINPNRLTIAVSGSDVAATGAVVITVFNPAPGGGLSNGLTFTITQPPNPVPTLTNLDPGAAIAGSGPFTLIVNGSNFVNGAVVRWQGSDRPTTFVSATQLQAAISANDIASNGTASVAVFNPASNGGGGGLSNSLTFTINPAPNPTPTINSLNPNAANAGSGAFTLIVNGSGFIASSVVRWQGGDRATTVVSSTQLRAAIAASDIANTGAATVTVFNPASAGGGGGTSNALTFMINPPPNPVPSLVSLSPNSAIAGSAAFTLTVNGANFINGAMVRWNGAERATTFVNATQLRAVVLAGDVANAGTANVTVFNPANQSGGGGVSNALTFTINNPVPVLTSLSPTSALAGSGAFTLIANGSNFINGVVVRWNGDNRATTFISSTQLSAQIPSGDLANVGSAQVTVFNPTSSGGGGASNALTFTINLPPSPPTLTSLNPRLVFAGGPAFTLTVNGNNFNSNSVVRWNGVARQTSFINATQLRANILVADIASAGIAQITVFNPDAGGSASNALPLVIAGPLANLSAASFSGNVLAAEMIVAAFGAGLATGVAYVTALPLPTTLLGTTVRVTDSAGVERVAPLFFVAPGQVNYLLPSGTAIGAATVTINSGDGKVSASTVNIAAVAPGLFSANANGSGVAAGSVLRVRGNGTQSFEPLSAANQAGQQVAVPIDLGPATDQLFLVLFGTGFRGRSALAAASATIGGVNAEVLYAGPQGSLLGLDQTNIRLPRVLAGRGEVEVILLVDGRVANIVKINVK
jgi:uncharacterized protein (TIGR03437 family)